MWVKICGTTNLEDALLAAGCGANAVGFIFAASPRRVTPEQVARITAKLPAAIERYGVFVDASFDEIVSTVDEAGLTGVQLHSIRDPELALHLREYFSKRLNRERPNPVVSARGPLRILQVLHYNKAFADELTRLSRSHAVDGVLVDSQAGNATGGTGVTYDWQEAQSSFSRAAPHLRIIVAGGLKPGNVANAIYTLQPWGVDVSTGVEAAPGKKHAERVRQFIREARMADAEIKAPPARA